MKEKKDLPILYDVPSSVNVALLHFLNVLIPDMLNFFPFMDLHKFSVDNTILNFEFRYIYIYINIRAIFIPNSTGMTF